MCVSFLTVRAAVGRIDIFLDFRCGSWEDKAESRLVVFFIFFQSQTFQHWGGVIVDTEPRRLRLRT